MADTVRTIGMEEARTLSETLRAANREGVVTIVTKRGVPYAAVVPVPEAQGCYGDAASFVREMRDE